ncbi:E3 ubiquitin-protein ligase AMFR [Aethina tumida]|uniref:E3 ubiquitin-protein ligase AMFR n=1 Tax=Aethina tumida TaxID=116153 RepID=UPI00096AE64A|nr:E3 ubiquitin-protein ligase AMFR [Aethina tumida]
MPSALFERFPMPNLKIYTAISVVALSACVYYAVQHIKDPKNLIQPESGGASDQMQLNRTNATGESGRTATQFITEVFYLMIRENVCTWTMINMAFCWLILVGRAVQKLVFGELRVSEQQHLKDKFWNFIFYKFIFVFGVINVQYIDEVLLWCSWFAVLGFLHLLSQLCTDRFEYLSFSPTTPIWNHVKLMCLLAGIFMLSCFMLLVAVFVGFFGGIHTFAFMSAEVIHLGVRTLHTIIRYGLHLYDLRQEGASPPPATASEENKVWERRGSVAYYTEIGFELTALIIDLLHHIHMLFWSNIFLSMASLVICMQMRYLFYEIQRKYKKHRNYLWVRNHLEQNYPMATTEELEENSDNCAICWEKMDSARKLPCTHLFHNTCLLSWLEQDTSCPTCRTALNIQSRTTRRDPVELQQEQERPARRQLSFFHFDGSRYVSWFPSFSVEINHANLQRQEPAPATTSQLDAMARQVQTLFPHLPLSIIIDDLRVTRSVELTVENVLDGRLVAPTLFRELEPYNGQSYSILQNDQPGSSRDWEDLTTNENIETEDPANLGSRFSKSSSEREKILQRRKEKLIHLARKRYIERQRAAAHMVHSQNAS